ncbi:phosphotransferase family protein [Streptomyces sp. 2A115]|uniref:phosphotransferase family protein n=1 Tax=Streptomyces sp. 2A115 TaxID=3457439 RepID=UPI003FD140C9
MSEERARQILEAAGLPSDRLAHCRPLDGGTYNTVEELVLSDGSRYVLKIPPPPNAAGLAHERELLVSEAEFYRAAATVDVPAPRVVAVCHDASASTGRHLLMTACPGDMWDTFQDDEEVLLRRELGRHVARLHRVTGPGFGYPSGALGPLAADWRTAFTVMYEAVLDDARRYEAWLPRPVDEVTRTAKSAYDALDEVAVPRLVHFDLWRGNILVERTQSGRPGGGGEPGVDGLPSANGLPSIGGLIDGERMFWGDPLADFVSLALLGDIKQDQDFLTGYQEVGGLAEFTPSARLRLALYRSYLYLIMLTETVPRAAGAEQLAWVRERVAPELTAALDELGQ